MQLELRFCDSSFEASVFKRRGKPLVNGLNEIMSGYNYLANDVTHAVCVFVVSSGQFRQTLLRSNIEAQIGRFGLYALLEIHMDVTICRHLFINGNSGHLFVSRHIARALYTLCIMVLGVENELHQSKDVARFHRPVVHHIMRFHEYFLHNSFKSISADLKKFCSHRKGQLASSLRVLSK